jgi:hypothetical protein
MFFFWCASSGLLNFVIVWSNYQIIRYGPSRMKKKFRVLKGFPKVASCGYEAGGNVWWLKVKKA